MKCGWRKHFAFQLVATPNLSTNTNIIKFCIFTIKNYGV